MFNKFLKSMKKDIHVPDTLMDSKVMEEMEDKEARIVAFVIYGLSISFFLGFGVGVFITKLF